MRNPLELLQLPYTFSQQPALGRREFARQLHERGLHVTEEDLDQLQASGALGPFYWLEGRRRHLGGVAREALLTAREEGHLHRPEDAAATGGQFVYSAHQIAACTRVLRAWGGDRDVHPVALPELGRWHHVAIVLSAIEPVHYGRIVGRTRMPSHGEFEAFYAWRATLGRAEVLNWLEIEPGWLIEAARQALSDADSVNTLGGFSELIGRADPDRWKQLRDAPRRHMDLRIAAEMLLREHERAVPEQPIPDELAYLRLQRRKPLDEVLLDFGLSPHPALILLVEGKTEAQLLPRVYELLGGRLDDEFIRIVDAQGVDRDVTALAAYIAPKVGPIGDAATVDLGRPPTRALVVVDQEGRMVSQKDRDRARDVLLRRMMETLPPEMHHPHVRQQIESLDNMDCRLSGPRCRRGRSPARVVG